MKILSATFEFAHGKTIFPTGKKILDNLPFQEIQENEGISEISVFFSLFEAKELPRQWRWEFSFMWS